MNTLNSLDALLERVQQYKNELNIARAKIKNPNLVSMAGLIHHQKIGKAILRLDGLMKEHTTIKRNDDEK